MRTLTEPSASIFSADIDWASILDWRGLTELQWDMLLTIAQHMSEHGCPPTVRDLMRACGIRSPNGICCHLKALIKKGKLLRPRKTARTIQLAGVRWIPQRIEELNHAAETEVATDDAADPTCHGRGATGPLPARPLFADGFGRAPRRGRHAGK